MKSKKHTIEQSHTRQSRLVDVNIEGVCVCVRACVRVCVCVRTCMHACV